jgi:hypothetical protein
MVRPRQGKVNPPTGDGSPPLDGRPLEEGPSAVRRRTKGHTASAPSVAHVAVPIGIAAYFWFGRRDRLVAGLCLAWAGTSTRDGAVYIADAPYERLRLISGEHDWGFVLGPSHLNLLDAAGVIAAVVTVFAVVLVVAGVAACASRLVRHESPYQLTAPDSQYGLGSRRPPVVPPAEQVSLAPRPGVRYPPRAMH